ncbi:hypothetical protein ACVFI8_05695 [Agarivorans sp. MS3-6]|uniref:hypothetical protein n=1 Tax=Agarivorans sp. TSD2052 TaxID=2937286 RepID=UPI002010C065|nr:hypothetical protein [Agarivorans sp. TSD2052]UPW19513.1 hypothetical protein M0C34_04335 [Agarivorans sp. TSD2052]
MNRFSFWALLLFAVVRPLTAAEQQSPTEQHYFWLEPGISYGKPAVDIKLDARYSISDYTIVLGAGTGDDLERGISNTDNENLDIDTFRIMVGKYFYLGKYEFLLEAGVAKVRFPEQVSYDNGDSMGNQTVHTDYLGIPVRFAKYFNSKYVGFALTADVMYTKDQWITTAGFSVPLGKLRR